MNFIKAKYTDTMADMSNICLICKDNADYDSIQCTLCELWTHRVCTKLTTREFKCKSKTNAIWSCSPCINTFPLKNINDHELRFLNTKRDLNVSLFNTSNAQNLIKNPFICQNTIVVTLKKH